MTTGSELDRRLSAYYGEQGSLRAPDRVLRRALAQIDDTQQRHPASVMLARLPWRYETMNKFAFAAAAVLVIVLVGGGLIWYGSAPRGTLAPGAQPLASATVPATARATDTPTPTPQATPSNAPVGSAGLVLSSTFASQRFGISLSYPQGWDTRAAASAWINDIPLYTDDFVDVMYDDSEPDLKFIGVASQPLGTLSGAEWINARRTDARWEPPCQPSTETVKVDGASGLLQQTCPNGLLAAFVPSSDRGYLIVLYGVGDRAVFDAVLASVRLHPEQALEDDQPGPAVPHAT